MVRRADAVLAKVCPLPAQQGIRFHFITEGIPEEAKAALEGIAARRENTELRLYSPAKLLSEEELSAIETALALGSSRWAKPAYYKLLAAELLQPDVRRVLYLDSDTVCAGSLEELFGLDLKGAPCAMCADSAAMDISVHNRLDIPPQDIYFNSGVVLLDLDAWRRESLRKTLLGWLCANAGKCRIQDQDAINACLHGRIFPLDFSYNVFPNALYVFCWLEGEKNGCLAENKQYLPKSEWPALRAACEAPRIAHIWAAPKPWHRECANPFAAVWRHFYAQSPWAAEPLPRLYAPAARAKMGLKRMGRKALEAARLIAPLPKPVPFPEEAYTSARRVLGELQAGDSAAQ